MRDIVLEETFFHDFTTRAFATGIPTVLAGTPVLSVLEENNATPITAGVSVSVDRASVAGLNMATIVATAANGYESGKGYSIYISTGTVGGVSVVGEVVGQFTIDASAAAQDLANGTDGLTALKAAIDGVPTTTEFDARTILSADYFDPAADTVANVTLVATTTTNTDMVAEAPLASANADAVWDETMTAHVTADSAAVLLKDVPSTSEFEARTIVSASYALEATVAALNDFNPASDDVAVVTLVNTLTTYTGDTPQTADHTAAIADLPTVAEFNARTIVSANYALEASITALNDVAATDIVSAGAITTSSGAVSSVTTTANLTTNNDKTGYSISGSITTLDGLNDITAADVLAAGDIDGFSLEEANKIELAALGGKLSGATTTTNTIRAADDSKDRITATVDADGNRSAVTLDAAG